MSLKKDEKQLVNFYRDKEENRESNTRLLTFRQRWIDKLKKNTKGDNKEEALLYKKFCEFANADPDKKFKLKHIDDLGINADVIVTYGKKGIGKTVQISKLIQKLAEEDPLGEVILVRNTVGEFQALQRQLDDKNWPIYLKGVTKNNPELFHKYLERDGKPRYMGFCVALNGTSLESAKGAEYRHIRHIIWDECTNTGAGNQYTRGDIERFVTFFDSIIRSKTNVKIYIFGNFHRRVDGTVSDLLLDIFQIPYKCKLKIIEAKSIDNTQKSKLLFINTGNLYSGVDTNSKIGLFGNRIEEDLMSNIPESECEKVGTLSLFYRHTPCWGTLINEGEKTYILLLSKFFKTNEEGKLKKRWMIHMEEFPTPHRFVHRLYTTDVNLYNMWNNFNTEETTEIEFRQLVHDLYEISLSLNLYYSNDNTTQLFKPIMNKWQKKYNLGATVIFNKEKRSQKQKT